MNFENFTIYRLQIGNTKKITKKLFLVEKKVPKNAF